MRFSTTLIGLGILTGSAVYAQVGAAPLGARNGALGGAAALHSYTNPLGGFGVAGRPGSGGMNRFNSGTGTFRNGTRGNFNGTRGRFLGYPYAYSIWVPDYFDYMSDLNSYYGAPYAGAPYGYPPGAPPEPGANGAPVIINQYFGAPGPGAQAGPGAPPPPPQAPPPPSEPNQQPTAAANAGDNSSDYYLIAYKNHSVYSANSYWIDDKTLHYVTTRNTHNQVSLDLIDIPLTKKLNQDRDIPFTVPGQ